MAFLFQILANGIRVNLLIYPRKNRNNKAEEDDVFCDEHRVHSTANSATISIYSFIR
jgi:hypothetical protein